MEGGTLLVEYYYNFLSCLFSVKVVVSVLNHHESFSPFFMRHSVGAAGNIGVQRRHSAPIGRVGKKYPNKCWLLLINE